MRDINTVRASFMPTAVKCFMALQGDGLQVHQDAGAVTAGGNAAHEVCEIIVKTGERPENLTPFALSHGCDLGHLGRATWYALEFWRAHGHLFPNASTEQELSRTLGANPAWTLTGHADVLSLINAEEGAVLDWKAGYRTEVDVVDQVRAYALLAGLTYGLDRVSATVVWLLDQTYQRWEWTMGELISWALNVFDQWASWPAGRYETGDHCHYCPRRFTCPAQQAMVKATIDSLAEFDSGGEIVPAALAAVYPAVQNVERLCQTYRDLVRQAVVDAGGRIPIDGETELTLSESSRDTIDPSAGWSAMLAAVGDPDTLAQAMRVSKTDLLQLVADAAPRGQKGKAKDELMADLRDAGAVTTTKVTSLRVVRTAKK